MDKECAICCEVYTKTTRKPIECNNCNHTACSKCVQHYVLNTNSEVKCMNCNVSWSMKFLIDNFSTKFCTLYRHHRREILWNKELYHIPLISEYIEFQKEYDRSYKECQTLNVEIKKNQREYSSLRGQRGKKITDKRKEIKDRQHELREKHYECQQVKWNSSSNKERIKSNFFDGKSQSLKRTVNRPCITEDCKGFVNNKGECPICEKVLCIECNIPKVDEDHECNEDDVKTYKELSKNTKPCPKCNVRIHKISGCDQMWCVSCNTAFSWSKGTIENGRIHNPHYFDWLFNGRQQENNVEILQNDQCNEEILPHPFQLQNFLRDPTIDQLTFHTVRSYYQQLQHNISVDLDRYDMNDNSLRAASFRNLLMYLKGDTTCSKNFESFYMKKDLYNEMYTILNNYKRNQIHLFRALFQYTVNFEDFRNGYEQNKTIFNECIKNFNSFYKKDYVITL